jgi:hypothetical protein
MTTITLSRGKWRCEYNDEEIDIALFARQQMEIPNQLCRDHRSDILLLSALIWTSVSQAFKYGAWAVNQEILQS